MEDINKFSFASRTNWPQDINALNKKLDELQAGQAAILDLTASNPTNCGFIYPQELLEPLSSPENFNYQPEPRGFLQARQVVSRYYARRQVFIPPDQIVLTASTSEAYSFLMRLLVNPGEKVLIPKPSYPLFQFLLDINDVQFDYYPLMYEGRWRLDLPALERLVDGQTRAIILVNPNNPTGSYISRDELNALNEICHRYQLSIISDEVFFEYAFVPADAAGCTGNQPVLTFTLGGLSKSLGLPQMKCSWILSSGPQYQLQEAMGRLETIADTFLSVNTPVQNALNRWLAHAPVVQQQILTRVRDNLQWLAGHKEKHTEILSLQGGWYATLRVPAVKSEEDLALEFLEKDHVLVYPGYFFDFSGGTYIILSLLPPLPVFQEAAGRILHRLSAF